VRPGGPQCLEPRRLVGPPESPAERVTPSPGRQARGACLWQATLAPDQPAEFKALRSAEPTDVSPLNSCALDRHIAPCEDEPRMITATSMVRMMYISLQPVRPGGPQCLEPRQPVGPPGRLPEEPLPRLAVRRGICSPGKRLGGRQAGGAQGFKVRSAHRLDSRGRLYEHLIVTSPRARPRLA
jgi:hypothetical protein